VRDIFENWEEYKAILKCNPQEEVSTDWVYAIACNIVGVEKTTLPNFDEMHGDLYWYLSDTISYIGAEYIRSKSNDLFVDN
jgi:hypothetical protein